MNKTGKKRDLKDQFYTKNDIAQKCLDKFIDIIKPDSNDLFIEPSAGNGSFSDFLRKKYKNTESYDIDPKKDYIKKCNFLTLDKDKFKDYQYKIHGIGNPPFGRQSSLAKKFIKHLSEYCDTISFILPKSFRTPTYQKAFPLKFQLIDEIDLDDNCFLIDNKPHHVPCVFQIWKKQKNNRIIEPNPNPEKFKFIKKPTIKTTLQNGKEIKINQFEEEPDFAILRAGGGKSCGRISENYNDGIACYPEAWLFIKLYNSDKKKEFLEKYNKIDWTSDNNVGAKSISKPIFTKKINEITKDF